MNKEILDLTEQLKKAVSCPIQLNEPMSWHTSFKIGGPADVIIFPENVMQLREVLCALKKTSVPLTLLGNGSNVLVRDKGIRGVVIKLGNMLKDFYEDGDLLKFGAGYSLALASHQAMLCGRTGMEFAVGIPGSIGGALYMNAGAYDGEMQNIVHSVKVMNLEGDERIIPTADLGFGYRKTNLQNSGLIVTEVVLQMPLGDQVAIKKKMDDFSYRRTSKQPLEMPSAGSMFKRPPGYFAGTLIDQAGLKGYTVGGAQISTKHAGFVVNLGGATAADVLQLISEVQAKIRACVGVELQPEVLVIGEE